MSLQVEIKDTEVDTFSGVSNKTKKPFSISRQVGWVHGLDAYPVKTELILKDATKPYSVGMYRLDIPSSVYIDRNSRFAISPVLIAVSDK